MTFEIPERVVLPEGTTAVVRGVAAQVIDGRAHHVVYTVEKDNGAWIEIALEDVPTQVLLAPPLGYCRLTEAQVAELRTPRVAASS